MYATTTRRLFILILLAGHAPAFAQQVWDPRPRGDYPETSYPAYQAPAAWNSRAAYRPPTAPYAPRPYAPRPYSAGWEPLLANQPEAPPAPPPAPAPEPYYQPSAPANPTPDYATYYGPPGAFAVGAGPCASCYGSIDALFWRRNVAVDVPLAVDITDGGDVTTVFSTQDLDFNYEPGLRVRVGKRLTQEWAIEAEYLGVFESSAWGEVSADELPEDDVLAMPGDLGQVGNVWFGADVIGVNDYNSELHSAEVNFVSCCSNCGCGPCGLGGRPTSNEWFIGFRYVGYTEDLNIYGERLQDTEIGPLLETAAYTVGTTNNLYGVQVGGRHRGYRGRFGWEVMGKAGLYGNDAEQRQEVTDFPNFHLRPLTTASDCNAAFVGELGLTGLYQLTTVWSVRAGYGVMWIGGLALAPDQLDYTLTGGDVLVYDGSVFYHGFHAGVEARW